MEEEESRCGPSKPLEGFTCCWSLVVPPLSILMPHFHKHEERAQRGSSIDYPTETNNKKKEIKRTILKWREQQILSRLDDRSNQIVFIIVFVRAGPCITHRTSYSSPYLSIGALTGIDSSRHQRRGLYSCAVMPSGTQTSSVCRPSPVLKAKKAHPMWSIGCLYPTIHCKRKQYTSVRFISTFLYPMVRQYLSQHAKVDDALPSPLCERNGVEGAEENRSAAGRGTDIEELEAFCGACAGSPPTLAHEGPITSLQLRALQGVSDNTIQRVFEFFTASLPPSPFISPQLLDTPQRHGVLLPEKTALAAALWSPASTARYVEHLCEARARKVTASCHLSQEGYLEEAGKHSRYVFAPHVDPQEVSAQEPWSRPGLLSGTRRSGRSSNSSDKRKDEEALPADLERQRLWAGLIDQYTLALPDRSNIHELENLPQEIAIGEMARCCLVEAVGISAAAQQSAPHVDRVVDVGGGNGFLAAAVAERLGCDAVVIDPFYPSHAIDCCPRVWGDTPPERRCRPSRARRHRLYRSMTTFKNTPLWDPGLAGADWWPEVWGLAPDSTVWPPRIALIAKHLCGTAVDECLLHLEEQCKAGKASWPALLVLVPCCFHRCVHEKYANQEFLCEVLHVKDAETLDGLSRLTAWKKSVYQNVRDVRRRSGSCESGRDNGAAPGPGPRNAKPVEAARPFQNLTKSQQKSVYALIPAAETIVEGIEHLMNYGRQLWLKERGYHTAYVEYVPHCVTPKNKCIVAYRF
eukprot:gene7384-5198_t